MPGEPEKLSVDFRSIVYRGVESDELDYKSAMNWNLIPRTARAKLVRHAMALANTKGGYIVIGVGEDASGHPSVYTGLSDEEAHSFDPSTVGPFINRHVEPPIDFTIERPEVDGKRYAVFVVRPFSTLPHVCAYGVEGELQQGVFYIRTTSASSRAAVRAIEMHALIQRALRNQRELLGRMLRGILYDIGTPAENVAGRFVDDALGLRSYFLHRHPLTADKVRLEFEIHPETYDPEVLAFGEIRHAAAEAAALLPGSLLPSGVELEHGYCTNTALRVQPEKADMICQLEKTGMLYFCCLLPTPGRKLPLQLLLRVAAGACYFAGRYYSALGWVDRLLHVHVSLADTDLLELIPASEEPGEERAVCRISEVTSGFARTGADLASESEAHASRLVHDIGERFNLPERCARNFPEWIRQYLENR